MNLANKLTLSRIVVIPFFLVAIAPTSFGLPPTWEPVLRVAALLIFVGASITDYYDGMLARRRGWLTNFGALMDPVADKILVMAAFVSLVELKIFPAWMVIIVLAREFMITGLRLLASAHGRILSADRWGKNKTISQMVTIITALTYLAARDWLQVAGLWEADIMRRWEISQVLTMILHLMMLVCVVLTIVSGYRYCVINYSLLRDDN
jgi:CDP-diacylglycerol--glycerol-3-phosphate 3-phosphatidyltransferase